ncbi:MAG: DUF3857 domain-containing protein [Candidatus Omnitrophota bacterium]
MHIIGIVRKLKVKSPCLPGRQEKSRLQRKNEKFKFWAVALGFSLLFLPLLIGCAQKIESKPQDYAKLSEDYYSKAIKEYERSIFADKNTDKPYFELGKLYYGHGDFENAVRAFQKSALPAAGKFIGIAYYRLGDYTSALEMFNRGKSTDGEYGYYYGLTCEKLNLFDQALNIYKGINDGEFQAKAKARIEAIERNISSAHIRDLDPEISRIIVCSPQQNSYPQAAALILWADEEIEVTKDNTGVSRLHYLIKILNERGKENLAEAQIEYDSTFEKVELEYARTIKPDGKLVNVGSRHIRDVSKYLNFPLYSNNRVFIISFPEVAIGSCLEYKLKIKRSELINKKDFVLNYPLQSEEPIISADFSFILPKEKKLKIKVINEEYNDFKAVLIPFVEERGDSLIYRWKFKDIPQIIPEPNMPPDVEINPMILLSTFQSWDEVYDWWWNLAKNKIQADPAIKQKVKALIRKKHSDGEKARSIYNFCAQNIRYVAVEYGQAGYEPHSASEIFKNKYGDCKDQAILLVTMFKEAGLDAYPVLISTDKSIDLNPDLPATLFNHCIVALEINGKTIFLDPTAQTCSFADLPQQDQLRKVLVFSPDGYKILDTPLFPPEHNLARQDLSITVNENEGVTADKKNLTRGLYDQIQRYWLLYTQPELIQDVLNNAAQEVSIGAKVDKYKIDNLSDLNKPVVLSYSFSGNEFFIVSGALRILPQLASVNTSLVSKLKRKYPIDLALLDTKEEFFEINLPGGFIIKNMPENLNEDSPWLRVEVEYGYKDNKVFSRQQTETKKRIISQNEYPSFKVFLEKIARELKQRIILEKVDGEYEKK